MQNMGQHAVFRRRLLADTTADRIQAGTPVRQSEAGAPPQQGAMLVPAPVRRAEGVHVVGDPVPALTACQVDLAVGLNGGAVAIGVRKWRQPDPVIAMGVIGKVAASGARGGERKWSHAQAAHGMQPAIVGA